MLLETALAEEERFELPVPFSTTVFKTAPLNHSGTPPFSIRLLPNEGAKIGPFFYLQIVFEKFAKFFCPTSFNYSSA